jgi:hypothetical protein
MAYIAFDIATTFETECDGTDVELLVVLIFLEGAAIRPRDDIVNQCPVILPPWRRRTKGERDGNSLSSPVLHTLDRFRVLILDVTLLS